MRITDGQTGGSAGSGGDLAPIRADKPSHRTDGSFAPGNRMGGRKPKAVERAYLDAVRNAIPPEEVETLLADALDAARKQRSWRGVMEVVRLAMEYGAGKPTQKTVSTDGNLETLLAALADDAPLLPPAPGTAPTSARSAGDVGTVTGEIVGEGE